MQSDKTCSPPVSTVHGRSCAANTLAYASQFTPTFTPVIQVLKAEAWIAMNQDRSLQDLMTYKWPPHSRERKPLVAAIKHFHTFVITWMKFLYITFQTSAPQRWITLT